MLHNIHLYFDVLEWRQSVREERKKKYRGRGLNLVARATNVRDIRLINMPEKLRDLEFHLTVVEGTPVLVSGEPFEDGIGIIILHQCEPARDDLPEIEAMVTGWFYVESDLYQELWQQVLTDNYSSSRMELEAGPFGFDMMEWTWDPATQAQLNVQYAAFDFVRSKRKEPPPLKKGLFS
ncbi:hypothetical protein [Bradyrhizobium guangxiense]|uniref:hypothetical protein n=1 Tax=Bradyrhizobium guangxiense TaxID=1325115 RepID=UPI00100887FC|nr:hypothetical protein [Bradyrhizobium guangxiense]